MAIEMDTNGDENDTGRTLFASLLRALQTQRDDERVAVDIRGLDTEETRKELEEWWRNSPFATTYPPTKADYEQFYRQLVHSVRQLVTEIQASKESSAVDQWVEADWPHDRALVDKLELFQASMLQLVQLMQSSTGSSSAATALALIRQLRQARDTKPGVAEEAAVVAPQQPADDKKPRTMAEKLAQMRERRSTMIKDGSLANVNKLTTPTNTDTETASNATVSAVKDDEASHLFTIETRLELKEKLRGLQSRLDTVLLETKLAWMKCFASEDQAETSVSSTDAATQLVVKGETLASHLLDAFTMARAPKCAIGEYKALVATCEAEMESFQALVSSMASALSPAKKKNGKTKQTVQVVSAAEPLVESRPQLQPVEFDLPSMKAYYAKAAASYTTYLPKKATYRR